VGAGGELVGVRASRRPFLSSDCYFVFHHLLVFDGRW
jgi:hypothetical protein